MVKTTISVFSTPHKYLYLLLIVSALTIHTTASAQTIQDDFEGNGNVNLWFSDDCVVDTNFNNPYTQGINPSSKVLRYNDYGGLYANTGFEAGRILLLSSHYKFTLKVYIPSSSITGNQSNTVSLKLQNSSIAAPWSTQSEIIKSVNLDQWQELTFDFQNDPFINIDPTSPPPTQRTDFNKVVIQVNGENNTDKVVAYLDDFQYKDTLVVTEPVFNTLVWSDEFGGTGPINSDKWFHQTQLPSSGSWYNGEVQHYTNRTDNSVVANGKLLLTARKETYTDQGKTKQFTSARLNSKFAFKYGRVEIRAKLPVGVGTWPALWMLGKNINETGAYWQTQGFGTTGWPACGEIDIMEHWGSNQNFVQSAMHTPSSSGATINHGGQTIPTVSDSFHVYAMEWTSEKIVFSVDNVIHYIYNPSVKDPNTWPFDADQYIIFNIAIQPSVQNGFTFSAMEVDYIRIYQDIALGVNEPSPSSAVRFYPNPVDNELHIVINEDMLEPIPIEIFDITGAFIRSNEVISSNNTLVLNDLGFLSKGIYILQYKIDNQYFRFKFLK